MAGVSAATGSLFPARRRSGENPNPAPCGRRLDAAGRFAERSRGDRQYLPLVEAIGSDGRRYFRSWTSSSIDGTFRPPAASESNPFAKASKVAFAGGQWTKDVSHGEMLCACHDRTLPVTPCRLQYPYQGWNPPAGGDYNSLPWRLGLLTQKNFLC